MTTRLDSTSTQPVTLAEAKAHLRVDHTADDTLITALIVAATQEAEQYTGRSLALNTWTLMLDAFPTSEIRLLWPTVTAVTAVSYVDTAGATQTLDAADYVLDDHSEPAWLLPAVDTEWPNTYDSANAVSITYTAGLGTSCPEAVKAWIKLRIGTLYEFREAAISGTIVSELPRDFALGLLDRYKVYA